MEATQDIYGVRDDLMLCGTKEAALLGADILVVCTEWKPFWSPDFAHIKNTLSHPVIFDGRNLYDPNRLQEQGIQYFAIGRRNFVEAEQVSADTSVDNILEKA
jgi:UDPglucose 6-dehydrogenase